MRLQTKLTGAFGVLALITLAVSLLALWQVRQLGVALHEVGAVRLPSIRGLAQMTEAVRELEASARGLAVVADPRAVGAERDRSERAWRDFAAGWVLYEPFTQTPEEAKLWQAFVPVARAWQTEGRASLDALQTAIGAGDAAGLAAARDRLARLIAPASARTRALLTELTELNYREADRAKHPSVTGYRDMEHARDVMIAAALVSVLAAIGFGVAMGRLISRPVVELAAAFTQVAAGDRRVKVVPRAHDEVAEMAHALNGLVDSLRVNESRLRLLADSLPDVMLYEVAREPDGSMRFLHVSAGVERLHGVTAAAVMQDAAVLYGQIHEEDRPRLAAAEAASFRAMTVFEIETRIRRPDGAVRWVQLASQPRRETDGRMVWDGLGFDVTERKRNADEARRANRALRALSHTNHALVHATEEISLLREVCRVVVEDGGYRLAWVGYAEDDAEKTVRPVAHSGDAPTAAYLNRLEISWGDRPHGRGPTGSAIRSGRPASSRNFAEDPRLAPWREEALRHRLLSSLVHPLHVDGVVIGALSIYASDPDAFDGPESALLGELAADLAYGIQTLRARQRHEQSAADVRRLLAEAEQGRGTLLSILEDFQQAEHARQASEQRFREAMHNAAIGMALVALSGRWLEVNPALCEIVGYTEAELLERDYHALTHPDDRGPDVRKAGELIAGAVDKMELEKRYLHKSGRVVWVRLNTTLVRDGAGRPLHFVTQTQDITARKQAEDSLVEAAERLGLALQASRFGVWRHDFRSGRTEWDLRMFELFGLPVASAAPGIEEIVARVAEEDRPRVRRSFIPGPACDRAYRLRCQIHVADGLPRHLEFHGMVHDDALGRPAWVIGVAGDITEIVRASTEAERLRAQLQQSQKMEALGNLAAGVAHDFNNLLTGINGFVELASKSLAPGHEAVELLHQARHGALSARDLVRRILNFSRSKTDATRKVLNFVEVVRDTAPLVAAALPANVSLTLGMECEAAPVQADGGQLQQILMNLCTNAAHAIGTKAGRITVALCVCELKFGGAVPPPRGCAAGWHLRLSVQDTGCGMDEATQRRIFEPFFTTKRAGEGTGIGLAIVHDIVTAHEGGLEVVSTPGVGTTFAVFLPLARSGPEPVVAAETRATVRGTGQRVLVVDDEPSVGLVVRLALKRAGYAPEGFTSPLEAWQCFAADPHRFDVVVVDQNMPELTGSEFVGRVRGLRPELPIIMMSGRFEGADTTAGGPAGVATLRKPFEIVDLVGAVKTALERPAGAAV